MPRRGYHVRMKLYTRTGDDGSTALFGGGRIAKDSLHIEACGSVDELNCMIGLAGSACRHAELSDALLDLQQRLFELGADLATPLSQSPSIDRIHGDHILQIEQQIDRVSEQLPPMNCFILPGGSESAARLHVARSVCRRAERSCFALSRQTDFNANVMVYLNRLSDLLFALARRANQLEAVDDVPWLGGESASARST